MPQTINFGPAQKFLLEQLTRYGRILIPEPEISRWGYDGENQTTLADLPLGLQTVQSYRINYVGEGEDFNEDVTEVPLATYGISGTEIGSKFAILGAKWSYMELETARVAAASGMGPNVNIVGSKRYALRRGLQQWMHKRAVFGDWKTAFQGILNPQDPRIQIEYIAPTADDNPFRVDLDGISRAQAVYDFISLKASQMREETYLTVNGSMRAIGSESFNHLLNHRFTDGTVNGTAKQVLRGTDLGDAQIREFSIVNEASGKNYKKMAGALANRNTAGNVVIKRPPGVTDVVIDDQTQILLIFSGSANTMRRRYMPITMIPPERNLLTWTQIALCGTSEVEAPQPDYVRMYLIQKPS